MDHIATIIVHYNTPLETKECLRSLEKINTQGFRHTIIVVDNGSKKPLKLAQNYLKSNVEVIRSESNLGFTGGNNLGMSYAIKNFQSDFILMLNSDTVVDPLFLKHLHATLSQDPKAGIAAPKIYFYKGAEFFPKSYRRDQKGNVIWYGGGSIDWLNLTAFHRGVDEIDRGQFDRQIQSDFATGCTLLLKREVIERVGILDKKFFLYLEDVDFSLRAKKAGFSILFCPSSLVWHKNAGSSEGVGLKVQDYYQTRNRLLLAFKHGTLKRKIVALRTIWQVLKESNESKRQAVIDFLLKRFGKQQIA